MGTQSHTIELPAVKRAGAVREIAVPPAARALSTLSRIDYEEAFVVEAPAVQWRTAEQWARAIFDDAPVTLRGTLWSSWVALGLRLGAPWSGRHVLGWDLRSSTQDNALLGARSRVGMPAELLVQRRRSTLLFATFVAYENRFARALWAAVLPAHRPAARDVLEGAARRWSETHER